MFAYYLHDLDPFIFHIWGNFGPRWYGMAYVVAFACGYWLLRVLAQRGYTQLRVEQVGDFITWAALFGVMLGGRLGYVLFYHAGNGARSALGRAGLGRRDVEPRRDDRTDCLHLLVCVAAQNFVDQSR